MLRLSIVIPACRDQNALETTLLSVLENRPSSCEVLVVCNLEYRDEYDLEDDEVRFIRLPKKQAMHWHHLANVGVNESVGEVVHVIQPGVTVEDGWTDSAIELLDYESDVAAVSPLVFVESGQAPLIGVAIGRGARRVELQQGGATNQDEPGFAPSETAGFYRRSSLGLVGGWDKRMTPDLANVELGCAIAMKGQRCKVARLSQVHLANHQTELSNKTQRPSAMALATSHELLIRRYNGVSDKRIGNSAVLSALSYMPHSVQYLFGRIVGRFTNARRPRAIDQEPTTALRQSSRAA